MANNDNKPTWPGWETVRLIGRGSFGDVYEIERDVYGHKERAAMKVISIPQNDSDIEELYDSGYDEESITATFKEHLESIVSEYTLMREMNGASNVVNCDDFRVVPHEDGIGWDIQIRMELLTPLTKALDGNPSDEQVIRIAKDMCNALILCRKHGIIHRDIKPQNIFVSKNGDYKLGDFGIAKTIEKTTGGTKIGTYKYMAPEVYKSEPYNHTADIYSLGLVLHWLLNERRAPFLPLPPAPAGAALESEAREKRFRGEQIPAPAHGSDELKRIVLKACAYDPKKRYQSAEEMLRDLEALSGKDAERASETLAVPPAEPEEETDRGTVGAFDADAAEQEERETEEEDEGTGGKTVGAFDRKDEPPAPPPKRRKWPAVLGIVGGILALLLIAFFTIHSWNPATCTEPETCKICGKTRGEALGHRYTEATCLEDAVCTICGDVSKGATGHDWGEPIYTWSTDNSMVAAKRVCKHDPDHVEEEAVSTSSEITAPASCTTQGKTTYTADFSNSAFSTQTKTVEDIPAIGHSWGGVSYTWSSDNNSCTATRICSVCGKTETETAKSTSEVTTAATCTTKGTTTYTATFNNSMFSTQTKKAADIAATGHDWGEEHEAWSLGNKLLTLSKTCKNDSSHKDITSILNLSGVTYTLHDDTLTISGKGNTVSLAEYLPDWDSKERTTLRTVVIEDGVTGIGSGMFHDCFNLQSVTLPDSVKVIGDWAFVGCKMETLTLPSKLTQIGAYAFYACEVLKNLVIPDTVEKIGEGAFSRCVSLNEFSISSQNRKYVLDDGVLFSKDKKTLLWVSYNTKRATFSVPDGVTRIGANVFECHSFTAIDLPTSVSSIGGWAFAYCTNLASITIPSGVKRIDDNSFKGCFSLKTITIPASLTAVGVDAFNGCSGLDLYYSGTQEQWTHIQVNATGNSALKNATLHFS